uniref:BTB domain-containing protein n=1 Tax=Panagrolaimus sp. JU765 TaxID=591449 RepID=A0AC34R780_9BILA
MIKFRISQESHLIVPENALDDPRGFQSADEQLCVFDDYSFYFICKKKEDGNIYIFLFMDCPKPIDVGWTCVINSIRKQSVFNFTKNGGLGHVFAKRAELFKDGYMKVDSVLSIRFTPEMARIVKKEVPHTVALLEDEEFKDFTFYVEDEEIKVHKSVLAVASPVFADMLKPHCKEFKKGNVDIMDFDADTINNAVELMYTRELDDNLSIQELLNLYKFAVKYDLVDKKQVLNKLNSKLSLTTLEEILTFASENSLKKLYEKCVNYFRIDFEKKCEEYEDFDDLDPVFIRDVAKKRYRSEKPSKSS